MSEQESQWVKSWLASVSLVLFIQAGTLIWFLAKLDSRIEQMEDGIEKVEILWEEHLRNRPRL